jgi:hypothetical protein
MSTTRNAEQQAYDLADDKLREVHKRISMQYGWGDIRREALAIVDSVISSLVPPDVCELCRGLSEVGDGRGCPECKGSGGR